MQSTHSLTVISLGGGVQSSVMALMASQGAFDAIPDCAIFADTHWEPPSLYTHLDWLAERLGFPVYIVDNGRSLREDVKTLTNHSGNHSFVDLPLYLKGRNGHGDGIGRRQCTEHYKHWGREGENPPVGLVLCSEKDEALARYALEGLPNNVMAAEYRITLPDEEMLAAEIDRTRQVIESRGSIASEAPPNSGTLTVENPKE